jgi:hypothetical protein
MHSVLIVIFANLVLLMFYPDLNEDRCSGVELEQRSQQTVISA